MKEFIIKSKSSKSKIYRFYKKQPELFNKETKLKNNKRLIPTSHLKYFNSELLFDDNIKINKENAQMRKLIDELYANNPLTNFLWQMEWKIFGAIDYKHDLNKKMCFSNMSNLFKHLVNRFGKGAEISLFFSSEPFKVKEGYHNHFILDVSSNELVTEICNEISKYFKYDRVYLENYNKYYSGVHYIAKEGLLGEDWDILMTDPQKRRRIENLKQ